MRLIDADAFLKYEIERCDGYMPCVGTCTTTNYFLKSELEKMSVIDAAPVKHGHWTKDGSCSECGMPIPTDNLLDYIPRDEVSYCCYCGCKMDEEGLKNDRA